MSILKLYYPKIQLAWLNTEIAPHSGTCPLCRTKETIVSMSMDVCLSEYSCAFPLVKPLCIMSSCLNLRLIAFCMSLCPESLVSLVMGSVLIRTHMLYSYTKKHCTQSFSIGLQNQVHVYNVWKSKFKIYPKKWNNNGIRICI